MMDEIKFLRKKYFVTPDKMICEVKDHFTFEEVINLLREYKEQAGINTNVGGPVSNSRCNTKRLGVNQRNI